MSRFPGFSAVVLAVAGILCFVPMYGFGQTGAAVPSLDETPPAELELFAPGLVSTDLGERDASFHPNGKEFYFTLWTGRFGVIVVSRKIGGRWSEPETTTFSGHYNDLEAFVAPDGGRLYFASTRPTEAGGEPGDFNLWVVDREGDGWSEARPLAEINTDVNEFFPSVDRSGTLYWTAAYENSLGGEDIWFAVPTDSGFSPPTNAGPGVNTERDEFNSMIAPDGDWLAFGSFGREDGAGGGDLYISFKRDGELLDIAVNMGGVVNSPALDFCPSLTPDGTGFIFSSRRSEIGAVSDEGRSYDSLAAELRKPGNGRSDLYWIEARFIEDLRVASANR